MTEPAPVKSLNVSPPKWTCDALAPISNAGGYSILFQTDKRPPWPRRAIWWLIFGSRWRKRP